MSHVIFFNYQKPIPFQPCVVRLNDPVDDGVSIMDIKIYDPKNPQDFIHSRFWYPLFEENIAHWVSQGVGSAEKIRFYMKEFEKINGSNPHRPTMDDFTIVGKL
jgi:ribosomal protein S16